MRKLGEDHTRYLSFYNNLLFLQFIYKNTSLFIPCFYISVKYLIVCSKGAAASPEGEIYP